MTRARRPAQGSWMEGKEHRWQGKGEPGGVGGCGSCVGKGEVLVSVRWPTMGLVGGSQEEVTRWGSGAGGPVTEGEAGLLVGDPGTTEAAVASPGKGDADTRIDVAHNCRVGLLPFLGEFVSYSFEEGAGFTTEEPISRGNKGSEVS